MTYLLNPTLIAFISSFTPGPNNNMLMQSGIIFGGRKTIPHILGIVVGFNIMFASINWGIYAFLKQFSLFGITLKIIGSIYFIYLSYKMITMTPNQDEKNIPNSASSKPFNFFTAFFFQWVNIKAWFYIISVIGTIPSSVGYADQIIVQAIILFTTFTSAITWTLLGLLISKLFTNQIHIRIIGVVLALSLLYIGISQWFYSPL